MREAPCSGIILAGGGAAYAALPATDFSRHLLHAGPENLAVRPVTGLD